MRSFIWAGFIAAAAVFAGEAAPPVTPPRSEATAVSKEKSIQYDGQSFSLASSTTANGVDTDEYTVGDETIGKWTQLVTVQRLPLSAATPVDAFVGFFRRKVADDGASLEPLLEASNASVFAVRFPKTAHEDEQVMICLCFRDPAHPQQLNLVQYALKPMQMTVDDATHRLKAWRDRLLAQGRALLPPSG